MATYYISSESGNDSTGDGSSASKWATFTRALTEMLSAGALDATLIVSGGTYAEVVKVPAGLEGITIQAASGETPIVYGGSSLPTIPPGWSKSYVSTPLFAVDAPNATIDGIHIQEGNGRGLQINESASGTTVKNVYVYRSAHHGLKIFANNVTIQKSTCEEVSYKSYIGQAMGGRFVDNLIIEDCKVIRGRGEGITAVQSTNVTFERNTVQDNNKACFYLDSVDTATINGCAAFYTANYPTQSHGLTIGQEDYGAESVDTKDITVTNNLFVGCKEGITVKMGRILAQEKDPETGEKEHIINERAAFRGLRIANNHMINATSIGASIRDNNTAHGVGDHAADTTCWWINNVLVQDDSKTIFWTEDVDRTLAAWVMDCNAFTKTPGADVLAKHTSYQLNSSLGLDANYTTTLNDWGDFNAANYKILTSSICKDNGTNSYSPPTTDYFGGTRPFNTDRDIGFHEFGATSNSLTAAISTSPATPNITAGNTVDPNDNSTTGGTASIDRWIWELIPYGTNEVEKRWEVQNPPAREYTDVGRWTLRLTIHDDTLGLTSTDNVEINVTAKPVTGEALFESNVVTTTAGTAAVAHGLTSSPVGAIAFMAPTTADDTAVPDFHMAGGVWDSSGNQHCVVSSYPDGETTSTSKRLQVSGSLLRDIDGTFSAAVSSVDATYLNLTWSGTTNSEQVTIIFFGGSGTSAQANSHDFGTGTTPSVVSGDYNLVLALSTFARTLGVAAASAPFCFGFASSGTGQMCTGANFHKTNGPTEVHNTTKILHDPSSGVEFGLTWGSGQYSIAADRSSAPNSNLAIDLALEIDSSVGIAIESADTPTDGSATDYSLSFSPGTMIAVLSNVTSANTVFTDENAGLFAIYVDDGTTQRTTVGTVEDAASPSNSSMLQGDDWLAYDDTGTKTMDGGNVMGASKHTLTMTTFDTTARKFPKLLIESMSTGTGPNAKFIIDWATSKENPFPAPGETVNFINRSTGHTSQNWDVDGDGSTDYTTADCSHVFTSPGIYEVELEVSDGSNTSTVTKTLMVFFQKSNFDWDVVISDSSGTAPHEVEVDWSGTSLTGGTLDEESSLVKFYKRVGSVSETEYEERAHTASGTPTREGVDDDLTDDEAGLIEANYELAAQAYGTAPTVYLPDPGLYSVVIEAVLDNGFAYFYNGKLHPSHELSDVISVQTSGAATLHSTYPAGTSVPGPFTQTYWISSPRADLSSAEITWTMGDGTTYGPTVNLVEVSTHTYATVSAETARNIQVDIDYADGTSETITENSYVVMFPDPVTPMNLARLNNRLPVFEKHLGIIKAADWVREASPNLNVYKAVLSGVPFVATMTWRLFEDGDVLTGQASIAACQANAGSYYITFAVDELTVYCHPAGSDSPIHNHNAYFWRD